MPIVTGLFSQLDLRTGEPAEDRRSRTRDYSTSATDRPAVASALAVALALLALWLLSRRASSTTRARVAVVGSVGMWRSLDRVGRGSWSRARVSGRSSRRPTSDDGWIWAQYRIFADFARCDASTSTSGGSISPLGYWPTLARALGDRIDDRPRLHEIAGPGPCSQSSWFVCRACLRLALGGELVARSRWVLAAAYLVGAVAWGMTLRPEPVVALLAVVSLWAMLSFARTPRIVSLARRSLRSLSRCPLILTGLVAVAPLVAGAPLAVQDSPNEQGAGSDARRTRASPPSHHCRPVTSTRT